MDRDPDGASVQNDQRASADLSESLPAQSTRPQRSRWPWLVALALLLTCGACGALGGRTVVSVAGQLYIALSRDLRMPLSSDDTPVVFTVEEGESIRHIAERLERDGFIRSAWRFEWSASATGRDRRVQAGDHTLRRTWNAESILDALLTSEANDVSVTLPEGMRAEEVADVLSTAGLVDRAEFLSLVANTSRVVSGTVPSRPVDTPALLGAPGGASLEGYLYPDTYRFTPDAGAEAALATLLANFSERVPADLDARAKAVGLSSGHEAVILASIVQREGVSAAELPQIARVYLNRLAEPPFILNADPTLQYALGFQSDPLPGTWWKRPLYDADKLIDSPYNSYQLPGLPPGPIASPGLAAIDAVLAPADGPWMYFVASATCDGTHVFAVTYEEHLANVERYVAAGCGG